MKGRKPKPTAVKRLTGNPGKRPLNDKEPQPKVTALVPACPRWLDKVAAARWDYDATQLVSMGVLTEADQGTLEMRSYVYSEIYKLREVLKREGRVIDIYVKDKDENVYLAGQKSHPAATQIIALIKEFRSFGSLLGLDPASRSKLSVEPKEKEDEFESFMKAKNVSKQKGG